MARYQTSPRKCRRGHIFIKDKFLLWHPNTQTWTIIKNCKYCIDAKRIQDQLDRGNCKYNISREERLLREIFGECKPSRFHKIKS
jgi:hypothetical protein